MAYDVQYAIVNNDYPDWDKHTFDFFEGMRMLAVVERHCDKRARLHTACRPMEGTQLMDAMVKGTVTVERLAEIAEYRARRLSQVEVEKSFLDIQHSVVHLFYPAIPREVREEMYSGHLDLC